mmetsp:Transcript_52186/g.59195  ORF Transcript_52186/g.59195 Transcript_52186/m.59195 type:complete len:164 (+) Transcript_52186:1-492(+)
MNLDYSDIVYYASQQKLNWIQIKNNQHMQQITNQVQNYIKNTLHIPNTLTSETMKRMCVSKPIVDRLWTISLQAERMFLLPPHTTTITTTTTATTSDNDNDDDNELVATLKADFEKETTTRLCKIDAESVLLGSSSQQGNEGQEQQQQQQQPNPWKEFFQSLK